MSEGKQQWRRTRSWLGNVRKIVRGRQPWSAESEFAYYAVSRRVVEEHRSRQDAYAAECWFSGMQIMRGMGILDTRLVGGARVLDIGAGECVLAGAIAQCGAAEVWAADAVPKQIWAAAEKLSKRDNIKFVIAGATDLPFGDAAFDLITANLVLHHIEPVAPVAHEVFRCLRPGGRFVAAEPTPLLGTIVHEVTSENEAPIPPTRIVTELTRAGFVDVSSSYLWVRLATSALGPLSPSYVITARKPGTATGPAKVTLRRPLQPMRLAGLQLDGGCAFAEQALEQERELLSILAS
ncbi:MAG: methyltransferase domain-containing protein [Myxococcales bacterium]|nr:methyltransferase domain-containing protein [Myxococcales bacterium]